MKLKIIKPNIRDSNRVIKDHSLKNTTPDDIILISVNWRHMHFKKSTTIGQIINYFKLEDGEL